MVASHLHYFSPRNQAKNLKPKATWIGGSMESSFAFRPSANVPDHPSNVRRSLGTSRPSGRAVSCPLRQAPGCRVSSANCLFQNVELLVVCCQSCDLLLGFDEPLFFFSFLFLFLLLLLPWDVILGSLCTSMRTEQKYGAFTQLVISRFPLTICLAP